MEGFEPEIPETVEELKQNLIAEEKAEKEKLASSELHSLGYSFQEKTANSYVLQKEGTYLRPGMEYYHESLNIPFKNLGKLVELAKLIEGTIQEFKEDLDLDSKGSVLGTIMEKMGGIKEKNIYNIDKLFGVDEINPDSKIFSFSKIAAILGYKEIQKEEDVAYINDCIDRVITFMTTIKVDEDTYREREEIAKKAKLESDELMAEL